MCYDTQQAWEVGIRVFQKERVALFPIESKGTPFCLPTGWYFYLLNQKGELTSIISIISIYVRLY